MKELTDEQLACKIIEQHDGLKKYTLDNFELVTSTSLEQNDIDILQRVLKFTHYSITSCGNGKFCFVMKWGKLK